MIQRPTVFCVMSPEHTERVRELIPDVSIVQVQQDGKLANDVRGEVVLLNGMPGPNFADVLARGVKWVHTTATGVDLYDLEAFRDVTFTNSRGAGGVAISEWVLTMMLAYEKQLPHSWITNAEADTAEWIHANLGVLYGRTLSLVGIGGIGVEVARRALAFGMRVIVLRRRAEPAPIEDVEIVNDLPALLGQADHLVLAAPSTPATTHLLDAEAFAAVKPGVHIVNISRGTLIDQEALRVALDDGRVAGASLDVVDPEPLPTGHWLLSHPRVKVSPHISWSAPWGLDRTYTKFLVNLDHYRNGEPLESIVDPKEGY